MLENLLMLAIAAGLAAVVIRYYFASKRRYMRELMDSLNNGEVS